MAELKDLFKSFAVIRILVFLTLYDGYEYAKKLDELSKEIAIYMGKKLVEKETTKKEATIPA